MKKVLVFVLVVFMVCCLIFIGCSAPSQPAKSTPTPTPTPTPKPAPIVLKYAHQAPPTSLVAKYAHTPRKQQIEEATKGRVTVELYPAQTLGKQSEQYEMARTGVCDITWGFTGLVPGKFPFSEIVTLPFLPSAANVRIGSLSLLNLYDKFQKELEKEFSDVKLLLLHSGATIYIATNKEIKTMEDLKGLKIRVVAGPPTEAIKALGAVPMMTNLTDVYQAMSTGLIDGYTTSGGTITGYKLQEVAKYFLIVPLYNQVFFEVMNLNRWNSLPPDIQQQLMSVCGKWGTEFYVKEWGERRTAEDNAIVEKAGCKFYELSPDELQRWMALGKPMWNKYIADIGAKGLPGQAALDEILRFCREYKGK